MYLLVTWILEANYECNGYGFPFDRPHVCFYLRAKDAYEKIKVAKRHLLSKGLKVSLKGFSNAINDPGIKNIVAILQERICIFDELRGAMRIALPDDNKGLNDDGEVDDITSIKESVYQFRHSDKIKTLSLQQTCYRGMVKQIDKYWNKLFCDPIEVIAEGKSRTIQPQRTNNILERFFRDEKHDWRKKSGSKKLSRKLCSIVADTPLVKNLNQPKYLSIILNGHNTLEERFSEIDIQQIREMLKQKNEFEQKYPSGMKKIFRLPDLPKILSKRVKRAVGI